VFCCDYCGKRAPLRDAQMYYVRTGDVTDNGDDVFTVSIGCGEFCARELANSRSRVGGR
jgi:hypothetical protein